MRSLLTERGLGAVAVAALILCGGEASANHLLAQSQQPFPDPLLTTGTLAAYEATTVSVRPNSVGQSAASIETFFGADFGVGDSVLVTLGNPHAGLANRSYTLSYSAPNVFFDIGTSDWTFLTSLIDSGVQDAAATYPYGPDYFTPLTDGPVISFQMLSGSATLTGFDVWYETGSPSPAPLGRAGQFNFGGGNTAFEGLTSVPEPGALALAVVGAILSIQRARRRRG